MTAQRAAIDQGGPDLEGAPDLIVRTDMIAEQWVVRDEQVSASACSVQEGEVTPGLRRLVRFTVGTANVGDADVFVGDPRSHYDADDGLYELATCHAHFHFRHYAQYALVDPATGRTWRAAKRGFCMLDTDPNPAHLGQPARAPLYLSCGNLSSPGYQGVSAGWTDTYRFTLGGQYFVLDGGDGQEPVPPGTYVVRVTVNPPFVPAPGEPCPYRDPQGLCHQLYESNYANNVGEVSITLPDHPGRSGYGPLAGNTEPVVESCGESR